MSPESSSIQLRQACNAFDLGAVRQLISAGADPNGDGSSGSGQRPLALALIFGQLEMADVLYTAGALPRFAGTALNGLILSEAESPEFGVWIDRIVDDAVADNSEDLQKACCACVTVENIGRLEQLLAKFPMPREFTYRTTPLCRAIIEQKPKIVSWLLDHGFDHMSHNPAASPPACDAISRAAPDILQRLLGLGEDPNRRVPVNWASFMSMPQTKNFPKNAKHQIFDEANLLHYAAIAGDVACAQVLISAGADINAVDSEGRTAADLAALGGQHSRAVAAVLPQPDRLRVGSRDDDFKQALNDGNSAGVQECIDAGVDVQQVMASEWTPKSVPMTIAACRGDVEMMKLLLHAGADIEQSDFDSAMKAAAYGFLLANAGLQEFANGHVALARTPLGWAAATGQVRAMQFLIDAGANCSRKDQLQFGLLHLASMSENPKAVELALSFDFDPSERGIGRLTCLHIAAIFDAQKNIAALLEAGANPELKDKFGSTAFESARDNGSRKAENVLKKLSRPKAAKRPGTPKRNKESTVGSVQERQQIINAAAGTFETQVKQCSSDDIMDRMNEIAGRSDFLALTESIRRSLKGKSASPLKQRHRPGAGQVISGVKFTDTTILRRQQKFAADGVLILRGIPNDGVFDVYVLPTTDIFAALALFGTQANNFGVDNQQLIAWMMSLHARHPFRLIMIHGDCVELRFDNAPDEPLSLVRELLTVCPPDLEEESLRDLKRRFRNKHPQMFLWWD